MFEKYGCMFKTCGCIFENAAPFQNQKILQNMRTYVITFCVMFQTRGRASCSRMFQVQTHTQMY